ncbi:hypothetical protein JVT61DRAFT_1007 [Boletus reticuloceps]|uniref:Uncharacterized protein n=1 Tax=Boletus reticuloceps TaxID=495285 RepID=A0A8I2YTA1_9AGAM|nr:hypothetical protein JVT61DRAFT_1007 [Boletus reticuloceps]
MHKQMSSGTVSSGTFNGRSPPQNHFGCHNSGRKALRSLQTRERGIRSRRVAVYTCPSNGNLVRYLAWIGIKLPLLVLVAISALRLATGLTSQLGRVGDGA